MGAWKCCDIGGMLCLLCPAHMCVHAATQACRCCATAFTLGCPKACAALSPCLAAAVELKVLTGDAVAVACKVCSELGMPAQHTITGGGRRGPGCPAAVLLHGCAVLATMPQPALP